MSEGQAYRLLRATGVSLAADFSSPDARGILIGVVLGLVVGKPLGVLLFSWLAVAARVARVPEDVTLRELVGAACLCGVGDTVALLMADQAFPEGPEATVAKIGVLLGSTIAAALGAMVLWAHLPMSAAPPVEESAT